MKMCKQTFSERKWERAYSAHFQFCIFIVDYITIGLHELQFKLFFVCLMLGLWVVYRFIRCLKKAKTRALREQPTKHHKTLMFYGVFITIHNVSLSWCYCNTIGHFIAKKSVLHALSYEILLVIDSWNFDLRANSIGQMLTQVLVSPKALYIVVKFEDEPLKTLGNITFLLIFTCHLDLIST